jgi:DAACS family dicarboxylate/amino acid:cation (Na+ or H+) symporter
MASENGKAAAQHPRLQWRILGGFLAGLILGLMAYAFAPGAEWVKTITTYVTGPIGQIFLRLLFMLVIPLLISALIIGVAEMGEVASLKKIGISTLVYTVIVSSISVAVSLATVNLLKPGVGFDRNAAEAMITQGSGQASSIIEKSQEAKTGVDAIISIVPSNFITAMSENDILAVMFFALFFGVGLLLTKSENTAKLKSGIEAIFEISMKLIGLVISLAPIAVFCFMFNLSSQFGWDLLIRLSAYVAVVLIALAIQMFGVFPLILKFVGKKSPIAFFRETQEALVMAFSTASSNATLPTALRVAETRLKLPPKISRFVLTIGATANQNGTAMFEGVTVIFLAQLFGLDLTLQQQLFVMLICILGGIGTAGVPAGSLPVIALILVGIGIRPEALGLILGVDRLLDMCRTTLNVIGDLVAAQVISTRHGGTDVEAG